MSRLLVIVSLTLLMPLGMAQSKSKKRPLSDVALDKVTAAGVTANVSDGVVQFQGTAQTANGLVSGVGTLAVLTGPLTSTTTNGTLSLNGSAQQNLSSLVNINAVNSNINVLLNLTVNMNSTVGTVTQSNLAVKH